MAQSPCSNQRIRGFTLVEIAVALAVLAIGLGAVAALFAQVIKGTARTEYMTQASTLASEKLEDLNRFPAGDPNVAITAGSTVGSLTADLTNAAGTVTYYDEVFFSPTQGAVSETISGQDAGGNTVYFTISHQPNGQIVGPTQTNSRANLIAGAIYFKRRWLIEKDQPLTGLRRITVYVFLENQSITPIVQFQMTLVRP